MIELNTVEWSDNDKKKIWQWYTDKLKRIAGVR